MSAGYSGTPLPKKLGIKEGSRIHFVRAPESFLREVGVQTNSDSDFNVVVAFCLTREELEEALQLRSQLHPAGGLWIAWPKRSSKIQSELTEDVLREVGLPLGIVDNKVCAIDENWSGLRFVWRKELRK
ncbi:MAG: hypothetical protein BGO01_14035 [Armatimonadetes bacterium 55-13]|nr:MAG: hypothetical protein BGO01_14035 [Armatimonadetes bacterium 55-13]